MAAAYAAKTIIFSLNMLVFTEIKHKLKHMINTQL